MTPAKRCSGNMGWLFGPSEVAIPSSRVLGRCHFHIYRTHAQLIFNINMFLNLIAVVVFVICELVWFLIHPTSDLTCIFTGCDSVDSSFLSYLCRVYREILTWSVSFKSYQVWVRIDIVISSSQWWCLSEKVKKCLLQSACSVRWLE